MSILKERTHEAPRTAKAAQPEIVELYADATRTAELKASLGEMSVWALTKRQSCDLELLAAGGFAPLTGFLGRKEYESVVRHMRLTDGSIWPIPITLDVSEGFAEGLSQGDKVALSDPEGVPTAVLTVEDIWRPDRDVEAEKVYGTNDPAHPGVRYLNEQTHPVALGGPIEAIESPQHHDFKHLRHTPREMRELFDRWGWERVVAFQTRNPMHRAHYEIAMRAARQAEANLLVHPVVGETKDGDIDYYTRVRGYQALFKYFPQQTTAISLLPLAMRMAGPREALWHALIRRNYGATHFVIGRDHAGPGTDANGEPFYGDYEAQELVKAHQDEIGIEMVPLEWMVYVEDKAQYLPSSEVPATSSPMTLSGTELRRRLRAGLPLPSWFSFPEVVQELRRAYPARTQQGFTVFFTGLSGAGKSTIAKALQAKFLEMGDRPVTLLDGDVVRRNLSSELGFSQEHRNLNIQRIGYVASEITKNRGIAICAPIAPYASTRAAVRERIDKVGGFILVHVATPLEVCERRDRKGLYEKARKGIIKEFTGVSDPYEEPTDADVVIDTSALSAEEAAHRVFLHIEREGYIA